MKNRFLDSILSEEIRPHLIWAIPTIFLAHSALAWPFSRVIAAPPYVAPEFLKALNETPLVVDSINVLIGGIVRLMGMAVGFLVAMSTFQFLPKDNTIRRIALISFPLNLISGGIVFGHFAPGQFGVQVAYALTFQNEQGQLLSNVTGQIEVGGNQGLVRADSDSQGKAAFQSHYFQAHYMFLDGDEMGLKGQSPVDKITIPGYAIIYGDGKETLSMLLSFKLSHRVLETVVELPDANTTLPSFQGIITLRPIASQHERELSELAKKNVQDIKLSLDCDRVIYEHDPHASLPSEKDAAIALCKKSGSWYALVRNHAGRLVWDGSCGYGPLMNSFFLVGKGTFCLDLRTCKSCQVR